MSHSASAWSQRHLPLLDGEDGNVTGGDVNYDGNTVPAAVQKQEGAKAKVAAAYRAVVDGKPGAAAAFDVALKGYESQYGPAPATSAPQSTGLMTTAALIETRNLAVTHQAQVNGFFCGPATGKMILNFLNEGPSEYNGAGQIQGNIGGTAHMKTWENEKTAWSTGLFRIGMNRWREGTNTGWYVDKHDPSVASFKDALLLDIQQYTTPFAADTVEFSNQAHYNGHPQNLTIGHWLVVHGFDNYGNQSRFADPSTSIWTSANEKFNYNTTNFVNTFLNNNGITW